MKMIESVSPKSGFGDLSKLYQRRARAALPILVAQARAGNTIFYGQLAKELDMPNPRNLNNVLGSVGDELDNLSKKWNLKIPPINCLVVNQDTGFPGKGVGFFMRYDDFKALTVAGKRRALDLITAKICGFKAWGRVLEQYGLEPVKPLVRSPAANANVYGVGGIESDAHYSLKYYVSRNPQVIGLRQQNNGVVEYQIPSGDELDVLFTGAIWTGIEVKAGNCDEYEIRRGIYQCVKYQSLLEAVQREQQLDVNARVVLVLANNLPPSLLRLVNLFQVACVEGISVPNTFRPPPRSIWKVGWELS
jgi:hypothetical protein